MENIDMSTIDVYLVLGVLVFFGLIEVISGYLARSKRKYSDWLMEFGSFMVLSIAIKPLIVATVYLIINFVYSSGSSLFNSTSLWLSLPIYLLIDDVLQYWYHRSAHEYQFLWKLHRAHHQAEEMGFFVSYRNAGLYYLLMPNIWWVGICTALGAGVPVAIGLVLKQLVIISSHSTVTWDSIFYKSKFLRPIVSLLERIIITPAFHHAHHGKSKLDGVSDPNGNFGNMFSIWDQIFGTAMFSRAFPSEYGLMNDPKEHWTASYFYPMIKADDPKNEMSAGHQKLKTTTDEPVTIKLIKGENYLWCACGMSQNQPFCDGTHHGSKHKPILFKAQRTGDVKLCTCKLTKTAPFCDDSHLSLGTEHKMNKKESKVSSLL